MSGRELPRLYPIVDPGLFHSFEEALDFAAKLLEAGVTLLQLRDKRNSSRQVLSLARELKGMNRGRARLIMNDRADLCLAAGFEGVHLGQEDLSVQAAREILGEARIIGCSTHNLAQLRAADSGSADYLAFGPIFATTSKARPDAVVGLEGLRAARQQTKKPLVAIGGITPANCRSVLEAGANAVAVISGLLPGPRETVKEFLRNLG